MLRVEYTDDKSGSRCAAGALVRVRNEAAAAGGGRVPPRDALLGAAVERSLRSAMASTCRRPLASSGTASHANGCAACRPMSAAEPL